MACRGVIEFGFLGARVMLYKTRAKFAWDSDGETLIADLIYSLAASVRFYCSSK